MLDTCKFLTVCRIPNSCYAPRCRTGYYNDHSGIPVYKKPSTQESIDKWNSSLHREGKLTILQILSLCSTNSFNAPSRTLQRKERYQNTFSDKSIKPQRLDKGRIDCDLQIQVGLLLILF